MPGPGPVSERLKGPLVGCPPPVSLAARKATGTDSPASTRTGVWTEGIGEIVTRSGRNRIRLAMNMMALRFASQSTFRVRAGSGFWVSRMGSDNEGPVHVRVFFTAVQY